MSSCTDKFEVETLFVPDVASEKMDTCFTEVLFLEIDPTLAYTEARESIDKPWMKKRYSPDQISAALETAKTNVRIIFEIDPNEKFKNMTRTGWQVISDRRVWIDIDGRNEPNRCEWGTKYLLQKKIPWWQTK